MNEGLRVLFLVAETLVGGYGTFICVMAYLRGVLPGTFFGLALVALVPFWVIVGASWGRVWRRRGR